MARPAIKRSSSGIRLKSIALPVEHGGWAFLIEPLLLGLLLAPSISAFFITVSAFGVFLIYQPLQIAVKDRLKQKRYPRTGYAERFAAGYGIAAVGGLVGALLTAKEVFLPPILLAIPFTILQMLFVLRGNGRSALAEISGALALSVSVGAIVMADGWSLTIALALCLILAVRASTSILFVRTCLQRVRGEASDATLPIIAQTVGTLIILTVVLFHLLPWTSLLAMIILLMRAVYGLYLERTTLVARTVGFRELGYGLLTVLLIAVGYRL